MCDGVPESVLLGVGKDRGGQCGIYPDYVGIRSCAVQFAVIGKLQRDIRPC